MDVRQLQVFLAVVDTSNVHRAAEQLHISQPAVSQALRRLERELDVELFHRTGRRLVLNSSGRALVDPARDLLRSLDTARATVAAVDGLRGGRLLIVSMPSQAVSPLAPLVGRFRRMYPDVEVAVSTAPRPDGVCEALRLGEAEIGLVAVPNGPLREPGFRVEPVEVQSYILIARDASLLPPGEGRVRPDELAALPLVIGQAGTGMRRAAETVLAVTGCTVAVEIEQREALLPLVLAGVGVAVVADSWAALARAAGLAVRALEIEETLHIGFVVPESRISPAAAAMLQIAAGEDHEECGRGPDDRRA